MPRHQCYWPSEYRAGRAPRGHDDKAGIRGSQFGAELAIVAP